METQIERNNASWKRTSSGTNISTLFKGSKPEGVACLIATRYEDGDNPSILQNRGLERLQRQCEGLPRDKENSEKPNFDLLILIDKKSMFSSLCSMGFIPFCFSGSHTSPFKRTLRTNYAMYYDNDFCVATISEGFGSFANNQSYIACRHAVSCVLGRQIDASTRLDHIIDDTFAEVERQILLVEAHNPGEMDTIITGCSLAILIMYKGKYACGIVGDCMFMKLSNVSDERSNSFLAQETLLEGISMNDIEERERVFSSLGEIRKNIYGKECIYVKGRDYPEIPMMSSLGCKIGRQVGLSAYSRNRVLERIDSVSRQCCLFLCNSEFLKIVEDPENKKLLSCINLSDANAIREYIYGKLKIQCLQKSAPVDDAVGLIFVMDRDVGINTKKLL